MARVLSLTFMSLQRDVRLAIRGFAKNPGFTVLAVLALALGIGASTLMFSIVDNAVLNPFPYADQHRLVGIEIHDLAVATSINPSFFTTLQFLEYAERNHVFDSVIGRSFDDMLYRTDTGTEQFNGGVVTPNTFQFLGVPALLGRVIVPDDGKPDAPPVFVMRYKLWAERFHSDRSILNQTFVLNGVQRTLIGIMPPRFAWGNQDMWIPKIVSRSSSDAQDQSRFYQLLGHLKPGISRSQADADLDLLARQLAPLYPREYPSRFRVRSASYAEMVTGDFRTMMLIMLAAVGLVLLIACGNVANLLLARAIAREKEFAIQAAMGATRSRVIQRLMLESLLLAIAGACLGWGFGWAGLKVVLRWMPRQAIPPSAVVSLDGSVLLFTMGITLLTVFIFGLAPALQVSRRDTIAALRDTGKGVSGGFRHGRLRDALVVVEVALSLTLLAGAGLLIRSFIALQDVPLGLQPDHILVVRPALPQARYKTAAAIIGFYRPFVARLQALPGVTSVAAISSLPLYGGIPSDVEVPGKTHSEKWSSAVQLVNDNFFSTLHARLVEGRSFNETELYSARKMVVVNQTFARKYLGTDNPLGAHVQLTNLEKWPDPVLNPSFEIVGVAADMKNQGLQQAPTPEVWIPYTVSGSWFRGVLIRTSQNPLTMVNAVRQQIWATDPAVADTINRTFEDFMNDITYSRPRFTLVILSIFAGLGLALAAIDVYGVIAYTTERQTHEIGIRMALGADRSSVLGYVIAMGLRLIAIGVGAGLLAAIALSQFIRSQLVQVSPYDPLTLGSVVVVLLVTGVAASWIPAHRATRVDPAIALRYE